jgi:alpha-beta hydrolase superfamily lysophospholipase
VGRLKVQSQERELKAADGTTIFITDWRPEPNEATRGGIVVMHGLGEHCGRYQHVARFFNDLGLTVRVYDHRGHGRSGGSRGDVPNEDCLLQDAKMVFDDFAQQIGGTPFLLGHSMGGLVAARFAAESRSPLRGLILSSPALTLALTSGQKMLFKILSAVAPGLGLANGLEQRFLSHDQKVVDAYAKDPLVHAKISARLLNFMLKSIEIAHAKAPQLTVPTLMVVAGDDHIVDSSGSQAFYSRLAGGVGTIHVYPQHYHEIFNEIDAKDVFDDIRNWVLQH